MRFTSYTVVDPSGRPCYHPDSANPSISNSNSLSSNAKPGAASS